ncbi:hypothetical protein [Geopsychrobacter electrodiphilus]|uniref:hypothetical protein n=1 Tax=Geopsychrobacter electrodiphilus TaxID=225196 RepID=UPI000367A629|nr:hypothetical protein [Geopsychrobacter electrodiphilus]
MWLGNESGKKQFRAGREAWSLAAEQARTCPSFRADDEDEQCAEEELSCYNCRYRRWTADSFTCQAP